MAETARKDLAPSPTPDPAPLLRLVPDREHSGADQLAEPNVGRSALIGAAIGFLVVALGIGVGGTIAGMTAVGAFGMGAMVGVWGGAGFGFMLGGTVPYARYLDADASRSHPGQGATHDPAAR